MEKLPIKISPWTWMKNFFTEEIKQEINLVKEEIKECKAQICSVEDKGNINEKDRIKQEILTFRILTITPNVNLKKLDFVHIYTLYDKYKKMGGNSVADEAIEEIKLIQKEFYK